MMQEHTSNDSGWMLIRCRSVFFSERGETDVAVYELNFYVCRQRSHGGQKFHVVDEEVSVDDFCQRGIRHLPSSRRALHMVIGW